MADPESDDGSRSELPEEEEEAASPTGLLLVVDDDSPMEDLEVAVRDDIQRHQRITASSRSVYHRPRDDDDTM